MDEGDYYRGAVTQAAPGTVRQAAVSKGESAPTGSAADGAGRADGADGGPEPATVPDAPGGSAPAGTGDEA
jgi:NADH-quinone oxidoreductase subunit I